MIAVFDYEIRFLTKQALSSVLWLSRKTDWWKLLQLPDISWLQMLVAAACRVVVVWAILRLVARVNEDVDPAEADREMLQALNDLRREGDLTDDEFRSIKGQITGRLNATWRATTKPQSSAKNAGQKGLSSLDGLASGVVSQSENESKDDVVETAESEESETIASPTNLPDPSQDTSHLAKRSMPLESEKGEGSTEAGSTNENNEVS